MECLDDGDAVWGEGVGGGVGGGAAVFGDEALVQQVCEVVGDGGLVCAGDEVEVLAGEWVGEEGGEDDEFGG